MADKPNIIVRFFRFIWRLLDFVRALIQLLILLVVVAVLASLFQGAVVEVPESAALVVAPSGQLVEEFTDDSFTRAIAEAQGLPPNETLVRDVTDALHAAADDDRIKAVVLSLDELRGGGLSKLRDIAVAIQGFRETGKEVIAMGDGYSQAQYYLAAQADTVFMHPFGAVFLEGFGYFRAYFSEALDKLNIDMNVFRVGEYKSFVEPFTRNDMSEQDAEAARRWLESLWAVYRQDIAAARSLDPQVLNDYANELADRVEAAEGNLGQVAVEANLVNGLTGRLDFVDYMTGLVGQGDNGDIGYSGIGFRAYLRALRLAPSEPQASNVGVIVASGQIVDGLAPPGTIGGDSLAALILNAATDDSVDAVVLRVDSPGGSVLASEVVFEALNGLKDTGKPLVASMGSVAASGGYYISMPADEIWADHTTITGSIGVGALLPTFQRSLESVGVSTDGFGTTRLSGQSSPIMGLGPDVRRVLQASVEEVYRQFLTRVMDTRDMSFERADNVAQGRVWSGADALELGLVDEIGGLDGAIAVAAERAGLEPDAYGVRYIQREMRFGERFALGMVSAGQRLAHWIGMDFRQGFVGRGLLSVVDRLDDELRSLAKFNDPRDLYYHCFCELL
jgi:protease-4